MAQEPRWAPYCPPATLLQVITHYRKRDVPERLTKTDMLQIGVAEGLINRTWNGLRFMQLIEDDGLTTENFRALRFATDEDYQTVLLGILRAAYANIFSVIDPALATEQQLERAFIPYSPGAQRPRMITLFLALCREAGIAVKEPPKQRPTQMQTDARADRPTRRASAPTSSARGRETATARVTRQPNAEDAALVAWFNNRPTVGEAWARLSRDRWAKTLMAIVDGLYPDDDVSLATDPEDQNERSMRSIRTT